ncbi:MAG: 30S ribosomal protein S4 [Nanoarchaeota archaeon]|nr:30S ribosomal protein S4 [Nanoarchaeota archaeon]
MGDPKKLKKKYFPPPHPWNRGFIEEGKVFKKEYGLKNRKEILIASSFLKKYKDIAKKLIATPTSQAEKEKQQVLAKLKKMGLLPASVSGLDSILGLEIKDIMERRAQSLVYRKGLARTMNQARQFIVHHHIRIGKKGITAPAAFLTLEEESLLTFKDNSSLADGEHPERKPVESKDAKKGQKGSKKEDKKEDTPAVPENVEPPADNPIDKMIEKELETIA